MRYLLPGQIAEHSPSAQKRYRMFVLWGQSHMHGGASFVSDMQDPEFATDLTGLPGCWIWDKLGRPNLYGPELVDADRNNEEHQLRRLTVGYGIPDPLGDDEYPWEGLPADPNVGPECQFAHYMRKITGDEIVIVKFARGGSHVTPQPFPNWHPDTTGSDAYLRTLITAYWAPALAATIALAGGDASKVVIGGVASMIGFSDSGSQANSDAYKASMTYAMNWVREQLNPASPENVPYLICKTPAYYFPAGTDTPTGFFVANRQYQQEIAEENANVDWIETQDVLDRTTNIHASGEGNRRLGQKMAQWALKQTLSEVTV